MDEAEGLLPSFHYGASKRNSDDSFTPQAGVDCEWFAAGSGQHPVWHTNTQQCWYCTYAVHGDFADFFRQHRFLRMAEDSFADAMEQKCRATARAPAMSLRLEMQAPPDTSGFFGITMRIEPHVFPVLV